MTVNKTTVLNCALIASGVQFGDEVLVPTISIVATANAVSYCNVIPLFLEVEEQSIGIDTAK